MELRALLAALALCAASVAEAQDPCSRAAPGSAVPEPRDLRSEHGVLKVDLGIHDFKESDGSTRYCYLLPDGSVAPTLRLQPGDLLVLHLKNNLVDTAPAKGATPSIEHQHSHDHERTLGVKPSDPCSSDAMPTNSPAISDLFDFSK